MTARTVYKICEAADWEETQRVGAFPPSELDRRDGFIHFSDASQVAGTLEHWFAGRTGLVLLFVEVAKLDEGTLRWEPSRDGQLFPHLHAPLPRGAITAAWELALDNAGRHVLPDGL